MRRSEPVSVEDRLECGNPGALLGTEVAGHATQGAQARLAELRRAACSSRPRSKHARLSGLRRAACFDAGEEPWS